MVKHSDQFFMNAGDFSGQLLCSPLYLLRPKFDQRLVESRTPEKKSRLQRRE